MPVDFVNFSGIRQIFTFCFKEFWYSSYLFITKTSIFGMIWFNKVSAGQTPGPGSLGGGVRLVYLK
jgi:hypothetical protein